MFIIQDNKVSRLRPCEISTIQVVFSTLALCWGEFQYLAQSISSLCFTICLSLNKQDTVTGRSELGMQAMSVSIIALAAAWLPGSYPFSGINCHFSVSIIISLFCLVPPFTLSYVLSSIFISLCSSSHVEMKKSSEDCIGGEHSEACV